MKIAGLGFNPYQMRTPSITKKENTNQIQKETFAAQESTTENIKESKPLTKEEKVQNFKDYILNKYKSCGLTFSSGLTASKRGIAPSFSIDPKLVEQAANDPQKAKELDTLINDLTKVSQNLFNATNHPPEVTVSSSVHIQADGTIVSMRSTEYSSLEAKNKYGGFDFNSFLDQQEELLKKNKDSSFDYDEAIGADKLEERRTEKNRIQEYRDEKRRIQDIEQDIMQDVVQEKQFLKELQQERFLDMKI